MAISALCSNCLQKLKVAEKFAGRNAMCPVCESRVLIPEDGTQPPQVGSVNFLEIIDKFNISDWDKDFCKMVIGEGLVEEKAIRHAIIDVRKRARSGNGKLPVGEVLVTDGRLTSAEYRHVSSRLKEKEGGGAEKKAEDLKSCPNCFETIPSSVKKCPYCAESLGDLSLLDMCPNCKHQQPPGGKFCQGCGADMESGLMEPIVRRKCPKCGMLSSGKEEVCPICNTSFDADVRVMAAGKAGKAVVTMFKNNVGYMIFIAIIIAAGWAYMNRSELRTQILSGVQGEDTTALNDAVDEWISALKYGDVATASSFVSDGSVAKSDIPALLGHPGEVLQEILEITKTKVKIDGDRAMIYIDSKIRIKQEKKSGGQGMEAIGQLLGGDDKSVTVKRANIAWAWALKDGKWLYVPPR